MVTTPTSWIKSEEEGQYRGLAMSQMRILQQQLALGKLNMGTRVIRLDNGVVITCTKCFAKEDVHIHIPPVVVEELAGTGGKLYVFAFTVYYGELSKTTNTVSFKGDLDEPGFEFTSIARDIQSSKTLLVAVGAGEPYSIVRHWAVPSLRFLRTWVQKDSAGGNAVSFIYGPGRYTHTGGQTTLDVPVVKTQYVYMDGVRVLCPGDVQGAGRYGGQLVVACGGSLYAHKLVDGTMAFVAMTGPAVETTQSVHFSPAARECSYVAGVSRDVVTLTWDDNLGTYSESRQTSYSYEGIIAGGYPYLDRVKYAYCVDYSPDGVLLVVEQKCSSHTVYNPNTEYGVPFTDKRLIYGMYLRTVTFTSHQDISQLIKMCIGGVEHVVYEHRFIKDDEATYLQYTTDLASGHWYDYDAEGSGVTWLQDYYSFNSVTKTTNSFRSLLTFDANVLFDDNIFVEASFVRDHVYDDNSSDLSYYVEFRYDPRSGKEVVRRYSEPINSMAVNTVLYGDGPFMLGGETSRIIKAFRDAAFSRPLNVGDGKYLVPNPCMVCDFKDMASGAFVYQAEDFAGAVPDLEMYASGMGHEVIFGDSLLERVKEIAKTYIYAETQQDVPLDKIHIVPEGFFRVAEE